MPKGSGIMVIKHIYRKNFFLFAVLLNTNNFETDLFDPYMDP